MKCEEISNPISFYDYSSKEILDPPIVEVASYAQNFDSTSLYNVRLPLIGRPCEWRFFIH